MVESDPPSSSPTEEVPKIEPIVPENVLSYYPSDLPSGAPSDTPLQATSLEPSNRASVLPSQSLQLQHDNIICEDYNVNYERMCFSQDPCCESVRSDTEYCWNIYEKVFPGGLIFSACSQCCPNKEVGYANPALPEMPKTVECSALANPKRLCKENSCCSNPRSDSRHCEKVYAKYGDDMDQICVSP